MSDNDKNDKSDKPARHVLHMQCIPPGRLFRDVWALIDSGGDDLDAATRATIDDFIGQVVKGMIGSIAAMRPDDPADEAAFIAAQDRACDEAAADEVADSDAVAAELERIRRGAQR